LSAKFGHSPSLIADQTAIASQGNRLFASVGEVGTLSVSWALRVGWTFRVGWAIRWGFGHNRAGSAFWADVNGEVSIVIGVRFAIAVVLCAFDVISARAV